MNRSYEITDESATGYAQAYAQIKAIAAQGHQVGGEGFDRVAQYYGSSFNPYSSGY